MGDDLGTVRRIYDLAGQPMTQGSESSMRAFMADHPRGRHGGVLYDLAAFGIDQDRLRRAMTFYADRFGVVTEV